MKVFYYTGNKLFVFGTEVDDFNTLNKDYIFTLNVCATQELHRHKMSGLRNWRPRWKYRKVYYLKNKEKLIEYGQKYYFERIYPTVETSIIKEEFRLLFD
jgi:hypothetical protein